MCKYLLQLSVIIGILQIGLTLDCYKCPVKMRDVFHCADPFVNVFFQIPCAPDEDVCLKISARGLGGSHIEERGCAKRSSVDTICNNIKQNLVSDDVTCITCDGNLCNDSFSNKRTTKTQMFLLCTILLMAFLHILQL